MVRPMLTPQERARGQRLGAALRQARGMRSMVEVAALADAVGVSLGQLAGAADGGGSAATAEVPAVLSA